MLVHDGPVVAVFAVVASSLRQSASAPTSSRFELFGSRMNGAMKFDCDALHESTMRNGAALQTYCVPFQKRPLIQSADAPPSWLR